MSTRRLNTIAFGLGLGLFGGSDAMGQELLFSVTGNAPGNELASAVSELGDVDGDGVPDVMVGAPLIGNGRVRVYSGVNGAQLLNMTVTLNGARFGHSVGAAGDVNGDGVEDVIAGAPNDADMGGTLTGTARVRSGAGGATIRVLEGSGNGDRFGWSVHGAGDVDGDGVEDAIVGAPLAEVGGASNVGTASIYSGANGAGIRTFVGLDQEDQFGWSVSAAGDVDGDGFVDVIVGANQADPFGQPTGTATVYSGADGSLLIGFFGAAALDEFGAAVSGAGDVDQDGHDDVIVGAPFAADSLGRASVFSGAGGPLLFQFSGAAVGDEFGASVGDAADIDLDGQDDVIVGAPAAGLGGVVRVYSGANGKALLTFGAAAAGDRFGHAVSRAGDVNRDGFGDLIIGAPLEDVMGADLGVARVFSGCDGAFEIYGDACPGSAGMAPTLAGLGCPNKGNAYGLELAGGPPGASGLLFFGEGQAQVPVGGGCFLLVAPLLAPVASFALDGSGSQSIEETIAANHMPGSFSMQAFITDPGTPIGFSTTNGLELTIP